MNNKNTIGPRFEPWGTSERKLKVYDSAPLWFTCYLLPVKWLLKHLKNQFSKFCDNSFMIRFIKGFLKICMKCINLQVSL